ncbi:MAG TPA: DUF2171 domain-containing protein [Sphingomicrobium sp.]|nr:DUF2171 domain-containing protein [Sphingomicrobium sp.]
MAYDRYDPELRRRERREGDYRRDMRDPRDREDRGFFERMGEEVRSWFGDEERDERFGRGDNYRRGRHEDFDRGYRPVTGDYSRSGGDVGRESQWDRDPYRRTEFAGSRERSAHDDPHYHEWRRRQLEDLDRDYDEYRRERQSRFEEDFAGWRERRMAKRQMLREIREHMEVVGSDGEHVGTIDRVAGDRIILTRSDPQSGGAHHSLACTDIDRVEGDRVVLELKADQARERWRDESRERALFEREDQGSAGPHVLDRSFSGTYR